MAKVLKRQNENETKLERWVRLWANAKGRDYDNGWRGPASELVTHGCSSGLASELIYHSDCSQFFDQHKAEINELMVDAFSNMGTTKPAHLFLKWDDADPLYLGDTNRTNAVWFAVESVCGRMIDVADNDGE